MKGFWLAIGLALLTTWATPSFAQTVRDQTGNSIGRIESDGFVRDASGNSIGRIESDGVVRDASGGSNRRL